MSIEQTISDLTAAVTELTAALRANAQVATQIAGAPTVTQAPAPVAPAPQPNVMAAYAAPVAAPAMPTLPTFAAPAPAPAAPVATGAPFADGPGLIAYVMGAYKEMGPTKGAQIQSVLTSLNYANINDVKPEHYGHLFQGVEALKRS